MTIAGQRRFRRSLDVVSRKIGDEVLVVPIRGGVGDLDAVFSFNSVGASVWTLLETEQSLEQLASWIVDHYEASPEQVQGDLASFVDELIEAGLAAAVAQAGPACGVGAS